MKRFLSRTAERRYSKNVPQTRSGVAHSRPTARAPVTGARLMGELGVDLEREEKTSKREEGGGQTRARKPSYPPCPREAL